jgi:hypothetical protein
MSQPTSPVTNLSRALWPELVRQSRRVVAVHAGNVMCDRCAGPGDCHRLRGAQTYLADPELLAAEREAQS